MAKILVIEDRAFITRILEIVVMRDGHSIIAAATGAQGLERLKQDTVDIVITDIGLPDMSGFDVIRAIKAAYTVPVIVLTVGSPKEDYLQTALSLGADAAFLKPVSGNELMETIQRLIKIAA